MDAVIVTANSAAQLRKLLACEELRSSFDQLIVVDNHCDDASPTLARTVGADVIRTDGRWGYGQCVNLGVRATQGRLFAVLNPDVTFPEPVVIDRLRRHFRSPDLGIVAPALVLPDGNIQDAAREIPTPWDLVIRRLTKSPRGAIFSGGDVPWLVGACFVASREAWDSVGGFDERYFLYFEDVDLCLRLRRAGWRIHQDVSVRVVHDHAASSRRRPWTWHTRQHVKSAARFYISNPEFIWRRSVRARSEASSGTVATDST